MHFKAAKRGAVYAQSKTKGPLFFALQEQRIENAGKAMTTTLAQHQRIHLAAVVREICRIHYT